MRLKGSMMMPFAVALVDVVRKPQQQLPAARVVVEEPRERPATRRSGRRRAA